MNKKNLFTKQEIKSLNTNKAETKFSGLTKLTNQQLVSMSAGAAALFDPITMPLD